jgi:DNA repair exonuclease SbcCD ATPase subunit
MLLSDDIFIKGSIRFGIEKAKVSMKMKISENTRIYIGSNIEQSTEKQLGKSVQFDKARLFAGNTGMQNSLDIQIEEKRAAAMEKAKKLIGDVFAAEKSVDDDLLERSNRIKESEQAIVDANKELVKFEEEKEKLKEQYGVTGEESEEELPEEYKMQRDEFTRYGEPQRQVINEAKKVIEEERKVIAAITVERLKSDPMVETSKQAEDILSSAEEEIAGMVMDDAMENLKEKAEEAKEKQEAEEEKAELEEAKHKEREERRKEVELSDIPVQELLNLEQVRGELKQEVDQMITEMKLLAEDIKGSMVDEEL